MGVPIISVHQGHSEEHCVVGVPQEECVYTVIARGV